MRVSLSLLLGAFALSAPSALADDNKNHPLAKACIGKIQEETCPHAHRFRHALHRCTTRDDFDNTNMEHVAGCIKQYSGCEFLTGPGAVCCYASSQVPSFAHNDVLQHLCPMCANPKLSEKKTDKKMTLASTFGRGKHAHQEDAEELSLTLETAGVKCETGHHGCSMVGDACLTGDGRTRGVCVDAGLTKGGQRTCTCDEVVSFEISIEETLGDDTFDEDVIDYDHLLLGAAKGLQCETGHHGCNHVGDNCLTGDGRTKGMCVDGGLTKGGQRKCTCEEVSEYEGGVEEAEEAVVLTVQAMKCETGHHGCNMVGDGCMTGDGRVRGVCVDAGLTKGGQRQCTCAEVHEGAFEDAVEQAKKEVAMKLQASGLKCETGHHGCSMVGDACLTGDGRTRGVCVDAGLTKGGQRACTCDEVVSFEISEEIEDETPSLSVSLGDGTSTIKEELLDALIKIISELTNVAIEIVKENLNGPNVSVSYPHAEAPWVTSVDSKAKLWAGQVLSAYYHPTKRHSATTVGHLGAKKSEAAAGVWAVSIQTKAISGNKAFYNTLDD